MKGGIGLRRKIFDVNCNNLTSIGCVYNEKIVNNEEGTLFFYLWEGSDYKNSESCNIRLPS